MKHLTNNIIQVKKVNVDVIRSIVKEDGSVTKQDVAKRTGLSVATCGTILNELVETSEVLEGELMTSKGGRPARAYYYNENYSFVAIIGVMVEGNKVIYRYQVVNSIGESIESFSSEYTAVYVEHIVNTINNLMSRYDNIRAIGISVPGIVHDNIIIDCDEPNLKGMDIRRSLDDRYEIDIIVEAEPRLKAFGYYKSNKELEGRTIALITAPEQQCIGAGIVSDGKIFKGVAGMAGEVRFMYRDDEFRELKDELAIAARAIISILNPVEIILSGPQLEKDIKKIIYDDCIEYIPQQFMPVITYIEDPDKYLKKGLIELTLELIDTKIKLINRE